MTKYTKERVPEYMRVRVRESTRSTSLYKCKIWFCIHECLSYQVWYEMASGNDVFGHVICIKK